MFRFGLNDKIILALGLMALIVGASGVVLSYQLSQRVKGLEEEATTMRAAQEKQEQWIGSLSSKIDALATSVSSLSRNVDGLSAGVSSLSSKVDSLSSTVGSLSGRVGVLASDVSSMSGAVGTLRQDVQGVRVQTEGLVLDFERNEVFRLLRKELANPSKVIADAIVSLILSQVRTDTWVRLLGESAARSLLAPVINSKVPTVVWHDDAVSQFSGRTYVTSVKTFFPIEVDTGLPIIGRITIAKVVIVIQASVGVVNKAVSNISVKSIQLG